MATPESGSGEGFAEGDIVRRHLPQGHGAGSGSFPPDPCCWIVVATTSCTILNRETNASCCWTFLATTECTNRVGGKDCCWAILATTACTFAQNSDDAQSD